MYKVKCVSQDLRGHYEEIIIKKTHDVIQDFMLLLSKIS